MQNQKYSASIVDMASIVVSEGKDQFLLSLLEPPRPPLSMRCDSDLRVRLVRLDEINEEKPSAYRNALANVYAALDSEDCTRFLYLLDAGPEGISLYFGVIEADKCGDNAHEALKNLHGALAGQLPGINLSKVSDSGVVLKRLRQSRFQGVVLGVPTAQGDGQGSEDEDFQGIERLVRTLASGSGETGQSANRWQLVVVCQPLSRAEARRQLDAAYDLASEVSAHVRASVQTSSNTSEQKGVTYGTSLSQGDNTSRSDTRGKNEGASKTLSSGESSGRNSSSSSSGTNSGESQTKNWGSNTGVTETAGTSTTRTENDSHTLNKGSGNSLGVTHELTDKRSQHLLEHLEENLIPRLAQGVSKGLFGVAIHLCADTASTYRRLKKTVCATYQGGEATASPLEVCDLPVEDGCRALNLPTLSSELDVRSSLFHSMACRANRGLCSLLTANELALVAGLPRRELPGLRRRKTVDFTVDLPSPKNDDVLDLGAVIDRGRSQPSNRVLLDKADFSKHIFVTGVTGAGKTTTCLNLLIESKLPFLVIEPAKTEYRALHARLDGEVDYYRPNGDAHRSLRLNPFALVHRGQKIKSHASFLRNVFAAVFPMEASMPFLVEQAILRAYEEKGWDLAENSCLLADDPFEPAARGWPTMSDMIRQLDVLIPEQGMGKEFEEKYRGSLVSRLTSLTHGVLGDVLDVPQSLDCIALLDRRVVIELEEIKDGEGKALMMALLLGAASEAIRYRHGANGEFRHLTLVEEAHRLLSRPEPGDKARALAVEAFADLLAEVRKYGEGLIISDQIPAKLIPDVIKNTHTKIVHRLFAEDDRRAMGEAMMMNDGQRDFLPNLATGEAVVFCGGWHGPTHAAIRSDHARTDRAPLADADVEYNAIAQLWRERRRYHPNLVSLDWLASNENASDADVQRLFASFVRDSRKAMRYLLALNPHNKGKKRVAHLHTQYFQGLKRWLADWQTRAITAPVSETAWREFSGLLRPGQPLTAPLLALLYDANMRPHAQAKAPVWPWQDSDLEWGLWQEAFDALLEQLAAADDVTDFNQRLAVSRPLKHALEQLGNYLSF